MEASIPSTINLTESLYAFARDLEDLAMQAQRPRLRDVEWRRHVSEACDELSVRAQAAREALSKQYDSLGPALEEATASLRAYSAELAEGATVARLRAKAQQMSETYEELRRRLKRTSGIGTFVRAPRLERMKPVNYRRNLFHVAMGLAGAGAYEFLLTQRQAIIIMAVLLSVAVTFEVSRRLWPWWNRILIRYVFRDVVRPWEKRRPNSASWYTLALLIICSLTPKLAAEIGVLVLAFGDPAASILGRKWGKVKLYRRKSIVGTGSFAVTAGLLTAGLSLLKAAPLSPWALVGMSVTVALAAASAELFSDVVDDNATVPITAACIATLWLGS